MRKQPLVFVTLGEPSLTGEIKNLAKDAGEQFSFIKPAQLVEEEFRRKIIESPSCLLLDYSCLKLFTGDPKITFLGDFSEILLIADKVVMENITEENHLPDNVSFICFPCTPEVFQMQIRQKTVAATRRFEQLKIMQKHKSLFVNSPQSKLLVTPDEARIVDANPAAASLFDIKLDDLLGSTLKRMHPDSYDVILTYLEKSLEEGRIVLNLKLPEEVKGKSIELEYIMDPVVIGDEKMVYLNVEDVTQKEKSNELFYQQAEMLRSTLESIDDLVFSLNKDGDFLEYYQPSGYNHLSLSADVFVGKNIYDVGFPLDVARKYIQTIDTVIYEDIQERIEYYLEAFGSRLWYEAKISPRKNAFGEIDGVTVICSDVTRQKKTEENLKKARDFYLTLLADFPIMIWKTNLTRRPDYFNKTWLDFTGNDLDSEMRKDWKEKIHPSDIGNFSSVLSNAYKNKQFFQLEHRLKYKSGEYRWVINAGRPFYNLDGQFAGFIGACYDISQKRKAEELLYLQKSAMESALEGIMIIKDDNQDYPVIYANKELARLTQIDETKIIGQSFLNILGCPVEGEIWKGMLKALKTKNNFKGEFFSLEAEDKKQWRLVDMAPVKNRQHDNEHFVAVLSDITNTKEVEKTLREKNKQLQKTNEELDRFVYSTSHELRSPLMSVLGLLNLLEADVDDEERITYLSMIRESISRLDKIIHDIIDYSRNSRMGLMNEKIEFSRMIDKTIQNLKFIDNFEKVRFVTDVVESVPFLSDKKRIEIIINNFISNSLRFHNFEQKDPFIEIKVKTSHANAVITITDNGVGIQEKHLPKIYEMFYRGTEQSKGSGIGLYIVKEIVEKLGGSIDVKSETGKGTTFMVDIPNLIIRNYKMISLSVANDNNL